MKKIFMIASLALLIAAGSAEGGFAAEKQEEGRFAQFIESIKYYITGQIQAEQETEDSGEAEPEPQPPAAGSAAQQVVSLTNDARRAAGLPALEAGSRLSHIAQMKAEDMAEKGYFSHNSPTYGSAFDMLGMYGISYNSAGENLARGHSSPQAAVNGWMNSSGHRENILGSQYSEIGVGVAENGRGTVYWVQIFKG